MVGCCCRLRLPSTGVKGATRRRALTAFDRWAGLRLLPALRKQAPAGRALTGRNTSSGRSSASSAGRLAGCSSRICRRAAACGGGGASRCMQRRRGARRGVARSDPAGRPPATRGSHAPGRGSCWRRRPRCGLEYEWVLDGALGRSKVAAAVQPSCYDSLCCNEWGGWGGCARVRCQIAVCCFSPGSPAGSCWTRQIKWGDVSYPPARPGGRGAALKAAHPHGVTARRPPAAQPPVPPARCFEARSSAAMAVATPLPPPPALR